MTMVTATDGRAGYPAVEGDFPRRFLYYSRAGLDGGIASQESAVHYIQGAV